jgi:predicted porin
VEKKLVIASSLAVMMSPVFAQSSVDVYGLFDIGLAHINNVNNQPLTQVPSGMSYGSRIGFRGNEDLGGGLKATFLLENGFNGDTGTFGQSSATTTRLFGRQAFVGLTSADGSLLLGRQYDFMANMTSYSAALYAGVYVLRPPTIPAFAGGNGSSPDFDRVGGARVDNSIKLTYKPNSDLTFGGMYGLGEVAGDSSAGRTLSAIAQFTRAPFSGGVAYTSTKSPTAGGGRYDTLGAGASYTAGQFTFNGLVTQTKLTATRDKVNVVEVGVKYQTTSSLVLGASYARINPNNDTTNTVVKGDRNQYGLIADYFLSKRTDIYALTSIQTAADGQSPQMYALAAAGPGSNKQSVIQLGIRHVF